jgi:hypothetical protein
MKYKKHIDARGRTLVRHVERIARAERVSTVSELKRQTRRVLAAIKRVDESIDTLARELARSRGRRSPHVDDNA